MGNSAQFVRFGIESRLVAFGFLIHLFLIHLSQISWLRITTNSITFKIVLKQPHNLISLILNYYYYINLYYFLLPFFYRKNRTNFIVGISFFYFWWALQYFGKNCKIFRSNFEIFLIRCASKIGPSSGLKLISESCFSPIFSKTGPVLFHSGTNKCQKIH